MKALVGTGRHDESAHKSVFRFPKVKKREQATHGENETRQHTKNNKWTAVVQGNAWSVEITERRKTGKARQPWDGDGARHAQIVKNDEKRANNCNSH